MVHRFSLFSFFLLDQALVVIVFPSLLIFLSLLTFSIELLILIFLERLCLFILLVVPVDLLVVVVEAQGFKRHQNILALDSASASRFSFVAGLAGYEEDELSDPLLYRLDAFLRNFCLLDAAVYSQALCASM